MYIPDRPGLGSDYDRCRNEYFGLLEPKYWTDYEQEDEQEEETADDDNEDE